MKILLEVSQKAQYHYTPLILWFLLQALGLINRCHKMQVVMCRTIKFPFR